MIAALLALLVALPPVPAAWVASLLLGDLALAPALVRVCRRESRCRRVGVHQRDAWTSRAQYGWQVRRGAIDPRCQPGPEGWATRGAFGLSAAAHAHRLPPCAPPWVHDLPLVQAVVAGRKLARECPGRRWCP